MSRCLPFPPPGYVWNGVSGDALSELIKVQRERVKAERERKEKKKRKKEKKEAREQEKILHKKRGHHKRHKALRSNKGDEERSENQGKVEYEILWMERSSLTDELEQPVSDSLYESSDNSQSIQRRRNCRCCFEGQNHDCSTSMMDSPVQNKLFGLPASDVQELVPTPLREVCNSPQRARINIDKKSEMALTESLYKELVVNWIPSPLQKHLDVGDQEWLFERKRPRSDMLETLNASKDVLDHGNSTSCPYNHCFLHSPSMINSGVQKTISLDPTPVKEPISSACGVPTTDSQVQHHSSSQGGRVDADEKFEMAPKCTCSETSLMQTDSQYRELVMNQVPPSSRSKHFDIGDQEWLFQTKQPRSDTRDTSTADYGVFHQGNFTQYPHAQYLPEVNIHALPYTIPY